jgi:hypothetical protein
VELYFFLALLGTFQKLNQVFLLAPIEVKILSLQKTNFNLIASFLAMTDCNEKRELQQQEFGKNRF